MAYLLKLVDNEVKSEKVLCPTQIVVTKELDSREIKKGDGDSVISVLKEIMEPELRESERIGRIKGR